MVVQAGWKPTIQSTQAYNKAAGVKLCVYGKAAVGKTPLALTVSKPLILASEDGVGTISGANLPLIRVRDTATLQGLRQWLTVKANTDPYDWIFLDSLSNLTQVIFTEIQATVKSKEPRVWYGELVDRIVPFLETLFSLDKNVVVTMWQGDESNALGIFQRHVPMTKGQAISTYCMHFFDVTMHMAKHQVQQQQQDGTMTTVEMPFLQTREFNQIFARDRHQKLDNFEPADLTAIHNKLIAL